ncbi:MAG: adenylate/guanylate cyclase domain-containing protein [Desulfobacterales bacterium]|nr:MAG: adenylate/guanylate cyclase domain-containing protein [Desulfobacterales bacterium]
MAKDGFKHRLAAILSADAVGYSRLISEDEISAVRVLNAYRNEMTSIVSEYQGRVVDFVGDNMLAEFSAALDAVNCAVRIQRLLKFHNEKLNPERRMDFRIGLHLGDIMIDGERIYGEGVNIAARIETLAEPGGICISDVIYKQIQSKLNLGYSDLGEQTLKNISEPVRVYKTFEHPTSNNLSSDKEDSHAEAPLLLPDKPSLAVLPFINLSTDPEQDYFCHGLYMDTMTSLVKISNLFLIGEASMFTYREKPVTIGELGRQLGVRNVLEGGVRKSGNRVRVNVQLIKTSNGRRIWAERFDRQLDDLFTIQDEIAEEIVTAMDVKLVTGEWSRRVRKALRTPEARECFYRGWESMFGSTKEDIEEAQRMFEKTIRLEPETAISYDMAAWVHWLAVSRGYSDSATKSLERATELAQKAKSLDPEATGFPSLMMAQIYLLKGEHDQAMAEIEKAFKIRPGCGGAHAIKANILNYMGRPTEAIELAKQAIRITPVFPMYFPAILARAYYLSERNEEAMDVANEILSRSQNDLDALLTLAYAGAVMDRMKDANQAAKEIIKVKPGFTLEEYSKSQPYKDPRILERIIQMLQIAGLK